MFTAFLERPKTDAIDPASRPELEKSFYFLVFVAVILLGDKKPNYPIQFSANLT